MEYTRSRKAVMSLVFALVLCTVAAADVSAAQTALISNSATAKSETGGNVGADGADGRTGAPGKDGEPGKDGTSVTTGNSSASAHIQTTTGDEPEHDVHISSDDGGSASAEAYSVSVGTSTGADIESAVPSDGSATAAASVSTETSGFMRVLSSIQTILLHYVDILF